MLVGVWRMLHTWPAKTIEVNGGMLGVRALRAARRQRRLGRTVFVIPFDVDLAVNYVVAIVAAVAAVAVRVRAG